MATIITIYVSKIWIKWVIFSKLDLVGLDLDKP